MAKPSRSRETENESWRGSACNRDGKTSIIGLTSPYSTTSQNATIDTEGPYARKGGTERPDLPAKMNRGCPGGGKKSAKDHRNCLSSTAKK